MKRSELTSGDYIKLKNSTEYVERKAAMKTTPHVSVFSEES
jgi:hypothetical protein